MEIAHGFPWFDDRTNCTRTLLPILEIGSALAPAASDEMTNLPRDFFEALMKAWLEEHP